MTHKPHQPGYAFLTALALASVLPFAVPAASAADVVSGSSSSATLNCFWTKDDDAQQAGTTPVVDWTFDKDTFDFEYTLQFDDEWKKDLLQANPSSNKVTLALLRDETSGNYRIGTVHTRPVTRDEITAGKATGKHNVFDTLLKTDDLQEDFEMKIAVEFRSDVIGPQPLVYTAGDDVDGTTTGNECEFEIDAIEYRQVKHPLLRYENADGLDQIHVDADIEPIRYKTLPFEKLLERQPAWFRADISYPDGQKVTAEVPLRSARVGVLFTNVRKHGDPSTGQMAVKIESGLRWLEKDFGESHDGANPLREEGWKNLVNDLVIDLTAGATLGDVVTVQGGNAQIGWNVMAQGVIKEVASYGPGYTLKMKIDGAVVASRPPSDFPDGNFRLVSDTTFKPGTYTASVYIENDKTEKKVVDIGSKKILIKDDGSAGETVGTGVPQPGGGDGFSPSDAANRTVRTTVCLPGPNDTRICEFGGSGNPLFEYLRLILKWLLGILGGGLLVVVIVIGYEVMFSFTPVKIINAKEHVGVFVGGCVGLFCGMLFLYTLNPTFYRGFGNTGGEKLEEVGGPGSFLQPIALPGVTAPGGTRPGTGGGPGTTNPTPSDGKCENAQLAGYAKEMLANTQYIQAESETEIAGTSARQNLQNISNNNCPGVQTYGSSQATKESSQEKVAGFFDRNAPTSFTALYNVWKDYGGKIGISSIYGGKHSSDTHREMRAFDVNQVPEGRIEDLYKKGQSSIWCAHLKRMQKAAGNPKVLGPQKTYGDCDANYTPDGGHNTHFHFEWSRSAAPPAAATISPPPNVAGVCSSTYDARLNNCKRQEAMTLAKQLLDLDGSKWTQYAATSAPGMKTREELQNIAAGACPCVEKYQEPPPDPSGGFLGAEANVQSVSSALASGGTRMLTSVLDIVNSSEKQVKIRTLGGGNHKYAAHRRFEAADIAVVHTADVKEDVAKATGSYWNDDGPTNQKVTIDPNAAKRLCETARWLLSKPNVQLVLVHSIAKSVAPCSSESRIARADDHYQHYHVQFSSASTGIALTEEALFQDEHPGEEE